MVIMMEIVNRKAKYDYEFRFNGKVDQRENVVFKRSEL